MERVRPKIICTESPVKQSFKDECDINKIMAKYEKNGRLPDLIKRNPLYGDFSTALDYQEALNVVEKAQMQFSELPAKARERFRNNPYEFLEFVKDPANKDELIKMGLATADPDQLASANVEKPSEVKV